MAVAEELSLRRPAERIYVAQRAFGEQVNKLERALKPSPLHEKDSHMSTNTNPPVAHDQHDRTNNGHEITMSPSAPPADRDQVIDRVSNHAPEQGDLGAVEQFIARVLLQAHETAEAYDEPDEARAILHIAVAFAAELETTDPDFDRLRFINAATGL